MKPTTKRGFAAMTRGSRWIELGNLVWVRRDEASLVLAVRAEDDPEDQLEQIYLSPEVWEKLKRFADESETR